jgi:type I restriction enzyme R subunit
MGNAAVHEGKGDHREALHQLRMARELAIWFQRSYTATTGSSIPARSSHRRSRRRPRPACTTSSSLRDDVDGRRKELEAAQRAIEEARKAADAEATARLTAQPLATKAREDAAIWEALATEQIEAHNLRTIRREWDRHGTGVYTKSRAPIVVVWKASLPASE